MHGFSQKKIIISIVVPVYNKETSLNRCFESLRPELGNDVVEVIFVDDGSTDGSRALCEGFVSGNTHCRLVCQSNQGVSSARNAGIAAARGDFLLFLDADDALLKGSLNHLLNFIDAYGEQVDVISYPILYVDTKSGTTKRHKREEWLSKEGVYSLSDFPYISQTTMNVCVKNRFDKNILFSTEVAMGEDQLYISENLCRKQVIGNCPSAGYLYTRDGTGASSRRNNPLYAFGDFIYLFRQLLEFARSNPAIASYFYQMILYNISWRIKSDALFPYHLKGEDYLDSFEQLKKIAQQIPLLEVIHSPYLNDHHKGYFMRTFGLLKANPLVLAWAVHDDSSVDTSSGIETEDNKTCLLLNGHLYWFIKKPTLIFTKCMERSDGLHLEGRLVSAAFPYIKKPELFYVDSNKTTCQISLSSSSFDYSSAKFQTTRCWTFKFVLPLNTQLKISFELITEQGNCRDIGLELKRGLYRVNARRERNRLYYPNRILYFEDGCLFYRSKSIHDSFMAAFSGFRRDHLSPVRRLILKLYKQVVVRNRDIWLYSDLPTSTLTGNAFAQFCHDVSINDGALRYYASRHAKELVRKYPQYKRYILRYGSKIHALNAVLARVLMASYLERYTYLPYTKKVFSGIGDIAGNQWTIYLQHGVLHAHLPWYYSFDRISFDKEVISTEFERDNLVKNYCFTEDDLIPSGMPRFDSLYVSKEKPRKIIYIPSWRNYLVGGTGKKRLPDDKTLLNSTFFKGMDALLRSSSLQKLLETTGYELDVKLHPNFSCYAHLMNYTTRYIHFVDFDINENDYAVVLTDFSSYVFDFVYAGCSVVYYMPDQVEFDAGLNSYRQLDLPLNNAFGPFTSTSKGAVEALGRAIAFRDGAPDAAFEAYSAFANNFFLHKDCRNSERLYSAVVNLIKAGC